MTPNDFKSFVLSTLNNGSGIMGKAVLHTMLPNDFELYLVCLELRDDSNKDNPVVDRLIFPVNPNSIMHIQKTLVNIRKSFSGIHVNTNDGFVPFPINLSGNFGRSLKVVLTGKKTFPMKTGFGAVKYLRDLIEASRGSNDNGNPYRLILYNMAFSDTYTVEANDCRYNQNMQSNMIWNYDLNLTAIAPGNIGSISNLDNSIYNIVSIGSLQKMINDTISLGETYISNLL